ncbi:MAG: hypothetical protein R3Y46_03985 [Opitutales bacterium]
MGFMFNLEKIFKGKCFSLIGVFFVVACLLSQVANAQGYNAGVVSVDRGVAKAPIYRIAIESDSPDLKAWAKTAFAVHGSYEVMPKDTQFVFRFTNVGFNAISLSITGSGSFEQVVYGDSTYDALLKACDLAVTKTLGSVGFFAGKIAFSSDKTSNKEIYIGDLFFSKVRQFTNDKSSSILPHWSADGNKLFYTGYFRSGFMDLYECDLVNKTRRIFANYRGTNTGGAPSPDGSRVAMILTSTGNAEIWTASTNKTDFKRITRTAAVESSVSFSPDGRNLVFSSDERGGPQIYVMPVNGGKAQRIPTNISGYCSEPTINPIFPTQIAFTAAVSASFQVAVYDAKTGKSRFVTTGNFRATQPKWCSDGRHIIFTKEIGKMTSICIVDSITGKQRALHSKALGNCTGATFFYPYK